MQGEKFLELLKSEKIINKSINQDIQDIQIDELFTWFDSVVANEEVVSGTIFAKIDDENALKLSIETSIINLPLRYQNAIDKIVLAEQEYEFSAFAIIEHPLVSQSGLFIKNIASVKTYLDDPTPVKTKIINFFDEKLAYIAQGGWQAEQSEATEEEVEEKN